ncbi:MAG: hypothetical protein NT148_01360, partial [Candidatus Nealsonbacteria bacterium]|nr:hypothetical protein [Candidatus Nealsonbacteria bacterium]
MKSRLLIISLILFGLASPVFAAGDYLYKSIDVDIKINKDSTFDVIENQTYNLNGNFGYVFRDIELKRLDHISDIEVFDGDGNKLDKSQYDLSNTGSAIHIQGNFERRDFVNEDKSWTIKYKVHGGLGF